MSKNVYIYILIMAVVTYAIRALPLTLIRGKIKNRFIQSFLYYIPYVTLSVMTFPAIMYATRTPVSGIAALLVGIIAAWRGADLFRVAISCCVVVLAIELFLPLF
ncbi:MAG: AzlD domain-containing protein [Clostridia bacterium]|nr:AzlD domain-containing protein [Clostridia bacterium]